MRLVGMLCIYEDKSILIKIDRFGKRAETIIIITSTEHKQPLKKKKKKLDWSSDKNAKFISNLPTQKVGTIFKIDSTNKCGIHYIFFITIKNKINR